MSDKKKYLIFILILISFVSISGISATAIDNSTSIDESIALDEHEPTDDSFENQEPQNLNESEDCLTVHEDVKIVSENVSSKTIDLNEGSYEFVNCNMTDVNLTVNNAVVNITSSNILRGNIFINGGIVKINNNVFTSSSVTQSGGNLDLTSNIITKSDVAVNVTGGITNLAFNSLYDNYVSLAYNSSNILYDNNWWGRNKPIYNYSSNMSGYDILQTGGIRSPFNSWLVLGITHSSSLDYDYWTAGVTYYNLTLDFTCNNLGQDTAGQGHVKDFDVTLTNVKSFTYQNRNYVIKTFTETASQNSSISNGCGECIFSLGYLTNSLTKMNVTVLGQDYTVNLSSNAYEPSITYITPSSTFDDSMTVEIECNGTDAVVFYTLDGTNPAYSPTRLIYTHPIVINESSTLHYTVIDRWGNFQKVLVDSIYNHGEHTFIKQDSYVELVPHHWLASYGIYYSLNGTTRLENADVDSYLYYDHPLLFHDPCEIYFFYYGRVIINDWPYIEGYPISINTYALDFSNDYIKSSSFSQSDAIWGQYQGNVNNTGVTIYEGPSVNQSSWSNENIISSGSAVIDGEGRIFVGGNDGYLYRLNNQGLVVWRYGTTSKIICTPTIGDDGNIYFSNWMDSILYCISPEGKLIWKHHLGDYNTGSSPVFGLDNRLYVISSNSVYSTMHVFKDGKYLSNHTIPFISGSTPVVSQDGSLYMLSADHELVIVNFDGSLRSARYIDTGLNHVGLTSNVQNALTSLSLGPDGTLYVINQYRSYRQESFSTVHDGRPATGYNYYYYAVNAFDLNGSLKWSMINHREPVSGAPSYYKGVLYITGNNNLIAVNASNGEFLWMSEIEHSNSTASSPLISGKEILYVTSADMVYAFKLNGDLLWKYKIKGNPISYSSPTLDDNGTLIVTTNKGIYAFNDIAADFAYSHVYGTETTIQFTDLSTKGNNRYYWMFGDGNISREQNPIHAYASEGKYRVVLLVEINRTVTVARNTTIDVVFYDITPPTNVSAYIANNLTEGGVFNQTQYVSLNASDDSGKFTIFYTTDGSNPISSKTKKVYDGLIEIEFYTVLRAVAVDASLNYGNISTMIFNITDVLNISDEASSIREIQKLLDNAEPGSKILFDYKDLDDVSFTINKPLNIISNANTRLNGKEGQPVFIITDEANGTIINGFRVYNSDGDGILIPDSSDVVVRNCIVDAYKRNGIIILNSENVTVKDTKVVHASNGIVVNKSSNSTLNRLVVSRSYDNGVWISESQNTTLENSQLEVNGRYQYSSRANQVFIGNSNFTTLKNNTITYGFFAIHLYGTNYGVVINNNTIYEGSGDAILLCDNYCNLNITSNLIDGCFNGINFMGSGENVIVSQNTIQNLHGHDDDLTHAFELKSSVIEMANFVYETEIPQDKLPDAYNGIQISYPASNFDEGNVVIMDNVIIKLSGFAWDDSTYRFTINPNNANYIYNLMDGFSNYNVSYDSINYNHVNSDSTIDTSRYSPGRIDMVIDRIGDSSYRLRLMNLIDNHFLTEIPSFDVTFRSGGSSKTVKFKNDSAIAAFDSIAASGNIEVIISAGIRKTAHFDMDITEGYASSNRNYDSGFEKGEAYDNPNHVVPSIPDEEEMDSDSEGEQGDSHPDYEDDNIIGNTNGGSNTNGGGNGNGSLAGNGNGGRGIIGNGKGNNFGSFNDFSGKNSNFVGIGDIYSQSNSFDTPESIGSSAMAGFEGSEEVSKSYEISKVIDSEDNTLKIIISLILFFCMALGYTYARLGDDAYEF